jgi:hypothetical protein
MPPFRVVTGTADPAHPPELWLLRSGGTIVDELVFPERHLKARIPVARQNELLERLEQLGKIVKRPATTPAGALLLELTIQW